MDKYPEEEILKLIKPAALYRQKNASEALKELEVEINFLLFYFLLFIFLYYL